jgi:tetratricopeptide (TPR) repeat protein
MVLLLSLGVVLCTLIAPVSAVDDQAGSEQNSALISAWFTKGLDAAKVNLHADAIAAFDIALVHGPRDGKIWLAKGYSLQRLGRYEEADACYALALMYEPGTSGKVHEYRTQMSVIAHQGLMSGTILYGSSSAGWKGLTIDNTNGPNDTVVIFTPTGTKATAFAVYVRKGYVQSFGDVLPDGIYDLYFEFGEVWNISAKRFDRPASMYKFTQQVDLIPVRSYTVTVISYIFSRNWLSPALKPISSGEVPLF